MKTNRKDQFVPEDTKNRSRKPVSNVGFGEDEDFDPREADLDDDDDTGYQGYDQPGRSNP